MMTFIYYKYTYTHIKHIPFTLNVYILSLIYETKTYLSDYFDCVGTFNVCEVVL